MEEKEDINSQVQDIRIEVTSINQHLGVMNENIETFLKEEDIYAFRDELKDLVNFNKANMLQVNQMMLELKGIVSMARGAIQEAHNVCVMRQTQKNTENAQLRKLLREIGKILAKEERNA